MMHFIFISFFIFSSLSTIHAQSCASPTTSDIFPSSPPLILPTTPNTPKIYANCSEKVQLFTQGGYTLQPWSRDNCPHLRTDLILATPITAGSDVTINVPTLLKACHLPANNGVINKINIISGGALIFDDADMNIHVREINVAVGGSLWLGSSTCRLYSRIGITFYGTKADSSIANADTTKTSKGIISSGQVEMHGKQYHPTWTRLSRTAAAASNLLYLQDVVNWEVGQSILIVTTVHYDCPTRWASSCNNLPHQNEIRTITAISTDNDGKGSVIQLDAPLTYGHYAGSEYQAEIALLSRRIILKGVQTNDDYGGHVKIQGTQAQGRFSGVQGENMGQLNVLARYPFHFHMMGEQATERNYFQDCLVTNSHFRGYTIHGTNNTRLSRNVAYNVKGMCFYLEDGVEERNTLEYNLAVHIHPIKKPANGPYGQGGEQFVTAADLIVPADTSASGFYIPNAYNTFVGNAASGGWSGFAFPNTPAPLGNYQNTLSVNSVYNPDRRPLLKFVGNSAHSAGFYWKEHGSCIYVGALQYYNQNGILNYDSGRHDRDTVNADGSPSIMIFQHTKAWLCQKGIAHWGNRIHIITAELTDVWNGAMLFGEALLQDVLINGRTSNGGSGAANAQISKNKMGFQFYDTHVKTIMSGVTFRNFAKSQGDYVIRYMDHSDQFLPQGINAVTGLKFENCDADIILGIQRCGTECGGDGYNTMSSKIYSVWDWDGSFTRTGIPSTIGSNKAWWNWNTGCTFRTDLRVYVCPWYPKTTVGYIGITVPTLMVGCDTSKSTTCNIQKAGYTVGRVSHWGTAGTTNTIDISPWPGVSGLTNTGWYWRPKSTTYSVDGAPSQFQIDGFQLPRSHFIVLAVRYPANAQFTVRMLTNWWSFANPYPIIPMASSLTTVLTKTESLKSPNQINCRTINWYDFCTATETGGVGPAWYFDGQHLYLRVVNPMCYNTNTKNQCDTKYSAGGLSIGDIWNAFKYDVQVTCSGCSVQSTLGSVTYWSIDDTPPSQQFNPDWGIAPAITGPLTSIATKSPFVCAANSIPVVSEPTVTMKPTIPVTNAPTTTSAPTSTSKPTTTNAPTTPKPVTTTTPPTTVKPVTTTRPPTTSKPVTTTKPPTTSKPGSTTKPNTTKRPSATTSDTTTAPDIIDTIDSEAPGTTSFPQAPTQPTGTEIDIVGSASTQHISMMSMVVLMLITLMMV